MKVYQSGGKKPKNNSNAVVWYVILLVVTLAVIITSIALTAGKNGDGIQDVGDMGNEVTNPVTTKPTTYTLPFEKYTVARQASLDSLVYMPAINMWKTHNGVDFQPVDGKDVRVMQDGVVVSAEQTTLEGWVVVIDHGDGLISYYKSLASATVKAGDEVKAGAVIGTAGTMMTESDIGEHVHIEMTKDGKLVDPLNYLDTDSSK